MDDDKKKLIKIIAIVACLVLAIGITVITNSGGGSGNSYDPKAQVTLMCTNEDCGAIVDVTNEEYREMVKTAMEGEGGQGMMMMPGMGPLMVECPECGEMSAMKAEVCPKCGEVFFMDYASIDDYPDRCPNCGDSKMEEKRNKKK
jgi:ribosomal protein L32